MAKRIHGTWSSKRIYALWFHLSPQHGKGRKVCRGSIYSTPFSCRKKKHSWLCWNFCTHITTFTAKLLVFTLLYGLKSNWAKVSCCSVAALVPTMGFSRYTKKIYTRGEFQFSINLPGESLRAVLECMFFFSFTLKTHSLSALCVKKNPRDLLNFYNPTPLTQ